VSARRTRGGGGGVDGNDAYRYNDAYEYDIPTSYGGPHSSTPYEYSHDPYSSEAAYNTYNDPFTVGAETLPADAPQPAQEAPFGEEDETPFSDAQANRGQTDVADVADFDYMNNTEFDRDGDGLADKDDGDGVGPPLDNGLAIEPDDIYDTEDDDTKDKDGEDDPFGNYTKDDTEDDYTKDKYGEDDPFGNYTKDDGAEHDAFGATDDYDNVKDKDEGDDAFGAEEYNAYNDNPNSKDDDYAYDAFGADDVHDTYGDDDTDDDDDYKDDDHRDDYAEYGAAAAAGVGVGAAALAASSAGPRSDTPIVDSVREGVSTVGDKLHRASARWKQIHGLRDAKDYLSDAKDYVADKIQRFREKMSGGDGGAREPNDVAPIGRYLKPWREQLQLVRWRDRHTIKQSISGRKTRKAATVAAVAKERKAFINEHGKPIPFETYEQFEQYLVQKWIKPTDIVLELGARCGVVSCTINSLLAEKSAHVAVEPDPFALVALRKNKEVFGGKFRVCGAAISDTPLTILADEQGLGNYTMASGAEVPAGLHSFSVKNIPREEFFKKYALPFTALVMDCEGCAGRFIADNLARFEDLEMVLFERDNVEMCDYDAMTAQLEGAGFAKADDLLDGFQQVWLRSRGGPAP
jgi:FkbM family methyltransferase